MFGNVDVHSLHRQIEVARARRSTRISSFLADASVEEKGAFLDDMLAMEGTMRHYATVSERLLVFMDNNVVQDILKRSADRQRERRFHAFLSALTLAQDYYLLDLFACVSPAVLYEAGGKRSDYDAAGIAALLRTCREAMADVGLATHFVGFEDADDLRDIFKRIAADEVRIRAAIDTIERTSWVRTFASRLPGAIRIPLGVAEQECPEVALGYFSPGTVKWILMHLIEKKMYQQNKGQPKARRLMLHGADSVFAVIKAKGTGVEGLGDIELLGYCDLAGQTSSESPEIVMAATYDRRLGEALEERSGIVSRGMRHHGGVDDPADSARAMVWRMRHEARRTAKANRRLQEYKEAAKLYWDEVLGQHLRAQSETGQGG